MSIDEMPQLINVLKGEMSLVGPRPEMPFIVERYGPEAYERLSVKPGITGLWQISPARAHPIHENLQYDLHYIRNQNLLLDCAIIVRTIAAVIHGVGAV
jgi:lipopolysaccharide/colanic/teichoic acid biosynthesis glycosyltransferase